MPLYWDLVHTRPVLAPEPARAAALRPRAAEARGLERHIWSPSARPTDTQIWTRIGKNVWRAGKQSTGVYKTVRARVTSVWLQDSEHTHSRLQVSKPEEQSCKRHDVNLTRIIYSGFAFDVGFKKNFLFT